MSVPPSYTRPLIHRPFDVVPVMLTAEEWRVVSNALLTAENAATSRWREAVDDRQTLLSDSFKTSAKQLRGLRDQILGQRALTPHLMPLAKANFYFRRSLVDWAVALDHGEDFMEAVEAVHKAYDQLRREREQLVEWQVTGQVSVLDLLDAPKRFFELDQWAMSVFAYDHEQICAQSASEQMARINAGLTLVLPTVDARIERMLEGIA